MSRAFLSIPSYALVVLDVCKVHSSQIVSGLKVIVAKYFRTPDCYWCIEAMSSPINHGWIGDALTQGRAYTVDVAVARTIEQKLDTPHFSQALLLTLASPLFEQPDAEDEDDDEDMDMDMDMDDSDHEDNGDAPPPPPPGPPPPPPPLPHAEVRLTIGEELFVGGGNVG